MSDPSEAPSSSATTDTDNSTSTTSVAERPADDDSVPGSAAPDGATASTQPDAPSTEAPAAAPAEDAPTATALTTQSGGKSTADYMKGGKVIVFFKATGNAPQLKQSKFKLQCTARFQNLTDFLRKQLRYQANDALFLFVNCTFQPSPDETIADLFKCFHNNGKLVINYATTAAWG